MKLLKMTALALTASLATMGVQAKTWDTVELSYAGTADVGGVYVKISDTDASPAFNERIFRMSTKMENTGLAVGLAAISSNKRVLIQSNIDEVDSETYPTLYAIYLTKDIATGN